eukprot:Opistho-1_new@23828
MADYSAVPPPSQPPAGGAGAADFSDALRRAREVAARLAANAPAENATSAPPASEGGEQNTPSRKRPLDNGDDERGDGDRPPEPERKRLNHDDEGKSEEAKDGAPWQQSQGGVGPHAGLGYVTTEEITVSNRAVGSVIGKDGETIKRLQTQTGARIQVAQNVGLPDRKITVSGTADAVRSALDAIRELTSQDANRPPSADQAQQPPAGGPPPAQQPPYQAPQPGHQQPYGYPPAQQGPPHGQAPWSQGGAGGGPGSVTIMVPAGKVGLIIGRGGEKIRELQGRSGARLQLIQDGLPPGATEKPLVITGEPGCVRAAQDLVREVIEPADAYGAPSMGQAPSFGGPTSTFEIRIPREFVGTVIGHSGETIRRLQADTGCRIQFQQDIPGAPDRMLTITGPSEGLGRAHQLVDQVIEESKQRRASGLPVPPPATRMGSETAYFPVSAQRVGFVIGRGGESIKYIQSTSGCSVQLDRNHPPDATEKTFILVGTHQQIEHAKALIMDRVNGNEHGGGSYGGGGGYGQQQQGGQWGGYGQQGASQDYYGGGGYGYGQQQQQQQGYYGQQAQTQGGQAGGDQQDYSSQWAAYYAQYGYGDYYGQQGQQGQQQGQYDYSAYQQQPQGQQAPAAGQEGQGR